MMTNNENNHNNFRRDNRQQGNSQGFRPSRGRGPGRGPQKKDNPFDSKILDIGRVTRVTKGGKQLSFRAVIVLGDRKGKVAIATGKGKDVAQAVDKATRIARKRFITVPMINGTIPHEVVSKYGAARIMLKPQKGGRGLIAGGAVRVVCSLAGIENITAKIFGGTKNKLSNAMATLDALKKLKIEKTGKTELSKSQDSSAMEKEVDPSKPRLIKKQK